MKLATIQDELVLDSLPESVRKVIDVLYGDKGDVDAAYYSGQIDAFTKAKENIRTWLRNNTKLPHTQILELIKYIDT